MLKLPRRTCVEPLTIVTVELPHDFRERFAAAEDQFVAEPSQSLIVDGRGGFSICICCPQTWAVSPADSSFAALDGDTIWRLP